MADSENTLPRPTSILISKKRLAKIFGITTSKVDDLINKHCLPFVKTDSGIEFDFDAIKDWLNKRFKQYIDSKDHDQLVDKKLSQPPINQVQDEKIWTKKDLMRVLQISQSKLDNLMQQGLPYYKLGEGKKVCVRFRKTEVFTWMEKLRVQ